jgi:hypothetical protein
MQARIVAALLIAKCQVRARKSIAIPSSAVSPIAAQSAALMGPPAKPTRKR